MCGGNRAFESSIERQILRGKSQTHVVQQSVTKFSISNVVFGSHFDVSLKSYLNVKNQTVMPDSLTLTGTDAPIKMTPMQAFPSSYLA
jgi:hypothetical protein